MRPSMARWPGSISCPAGRAPSPRIWREPRAEIQAGGVALRRCQGRARRGRRIRPGRAGRAAQPDHGQSDRGQPLRHQPQHRLRLPDGEGGREGALASPHPGCPAARGRGQARHLYGGRRRARRHAAGRRGADAVVVLARPRQRERSDQLLDRLPRRAVRAAHRSDVLRAQSGGLRTGHQECAVALSHSGARGAGAGQRREDRRDRQGRDADDRAASDAAALRRPPRRRQDHREQSLLGHQRRSADQGRRRHECKPRGRRCHHGAVLAFRTRSRPRATRCCCG